MPQLPEPIVLSEPEPASPGGRWFNRAARALFLEHRLPTAVADSLDRLAILSKRPDKRLAVNDPEGGYQPARFHVRRQSSDPFFVAEVFNDHAYSPPGYEICESDTVIDVGANIGAFTIFAARRAKRGKVVAIEPTQDSFSLLERNIRRNRLGNISAERAAITDADRTVTLYLSSLGTGQHSLDAALAGPSLSSETVPGLALSDLFEKHNLEICNYLKLDCEGAEFSIFKTITPDLAARIRRIGLEYHTQPASPKREQSDALARRLLDFGFTIDIYTDVVETNRGMLFARR